MLAKWRKFKENTYEKLGKPDTTPKGGPEENASGGSPLKRNGPENLNTEHVGDQGTYTVPDCYIGKPADIEAKRLVAAPMHQNK
eukprot:8574599-Karenia_brevis.AAC.1